METATFDSEERLMEIFEREKILNNIQNQNTKQLWNVIKNVTVFVHEQVESNDSPKEIKEALRNQITIVKNVVVEILATLEAENAKDEDEENLNPDKTETQKVNMPLSILDSIVDNWPKLPSKKNAKKLRKKLRKKVGSVLDEKVDNSQERTKHELEILEAEKLSIFNEICQNLTQEIPQLEEVESFIEFSENRFQPFENIFKNYLANIESAQKDFLTIQEIFEAKKYEIFFAKFKELERNIDILDIDNVLNFSKEFGKFRTTCIKYFSEYDSSECYKARQYVTVLKDKLKSKIKELANGDLSTITDIKPEIAQFLVDNTSYQISLPNIEVISIESAKILATYEKSLSLGITELNSDIAEIFSKRKGALIFPRLTEISEETSVILKNYQCSFLGLVGLESLSDESAFHIGQFDSRRLVEEELGRSVTLKLQSLKNISPEGLAHLMQFKGDFIKNFGFTSLSIEQAKVLVQFSDMTEKLQLNDLELISLEVAQELAKVDGDLFLGLSDLPLNIVQELTSKNFGLYLNGLTEISEELAKVLAQHQGFLALNNVKNISKEVLEILFSRKAPLSLKGIDEETEKLASSISSDFRNLMYLKTKIS